ncbi:MAG: hypothetical protein VB055_01705 [Oscillospiraceae bacterium]|nr:hypothetical protein [Oscillospiraceae bacterium]
MKDQTLRDSVRKIEMPDDMRRRMVRRIAAASRKGRPAAPWSKPLAALLAVALCLTLTVPVLAATVDPAYALLYQVSPALAQMFRPVRESDENQGIRMEVVSAHIYDSTAEIYITMQDLTGDRIDGTTDLYDSYSINRPFDSSASCQRVAYDESTKTVTFLVTITQWGTQAIDGDKITFSVREFLSHKTHAAGVTIPVDLTGSATATQTVNPFGYGGNFPLSHEALVLVPGEAVTDSPADGIDVTAIGFIGDQLHVQIALQNRLETDNHGFLYLLDQDGTRIDSSGNVYFTSRSEQADGTDYCEYVFDVPRAEIGNYTLYGDFISAGMRTTGNWSVTFPLESTSYG